MDTVLHSDHGLSMIDIAMLEAKRREYDAERVNAEQTLLRIQGALIAIDDLIATLQAQEQETAKE